MQTTTTEQDMSAKSRTYYEVMNQRFAIQMQSVVAIDQKIGVWFQAAPLVTTLLTGLFIAVRDGANAAALVCAALGVVAFAGSLTLLYIAQRPGDFPQDMKWEYIAGNVYDDATPIGQFHYELASDLAQTTIPAILAGVNRKSRILGRALVCFTLSTALLMGAILLAIAHANKLL